MKFARWASVCIAALAPAARGAVDFRNYDELYLHTVHNLVPKDDGDWLGVKNVSTHVSGATSSSRGSWGASAANANSQHNQEVYVSVAAMEPTAFVIDSRASTCPCPPAQNLGGLVMVGYVRPESRQRIAPTADLDDGREYNLMFSDDLGSALGVIDASESQVSSLSGVSGGGGVSGGSSMETFILVSAGVMLITLGFVVAVRKSG